MGGVNAGVSADPESPPYLALPPGAIFRLAMRIPVTLERDETGMIVAECPAIPGCVSQGRTEAEALANIHEAVVGCLEVRAEEGLPLTVRTVDIEVKVARAARPFRAGCSLCARAPRMGVPTTAR